tara:strand:+ start:18 stop:1532 length:1515 start_codon:yes stop_codon:yes gene_type:complete
MIYIGMSIQRRGITSQFIKPFILENFKVIPNYLKGRKSKPKKIEIFFDKKGEIRLEKNRQKALKEGILRTHDFSWVKSTIAYAEDTMNCKVRLKGDGLDHLEGEKWSLRIKLKKSNHLYGMKVFSLQDPYTRNYIYEWIFHQTLKQEGIIGLYYDFVEIFINDDNKGVFAIEEHFDRNLISNNNKPEGVVLKNDEDFFWENPITPKNTNSYDECWLNSHFNNFNKLDSVELKYYEILKEKLYLFKTGNLTTSEVFDTDLLSKYFAICDLMDGGHAVNWNNIRWYYNSLTNKVEPIGFDKGRGFSIVNLIGTNSREDIHRPLRINSFFGDYNFCKKYIKQLCRVSEPAFLDSLLSNIDDDLQSKLNIIYKDYPYFNYTKKYFIKNQNFIKGMLNPNKPLYSELVSLADSIHFYFTNIHYLPLKIHSISKTLSSENLLEKSLIIPSNEIQIPPQVLSINIYRDKNKSQFLSYYVSYSVLGIDSIISEKISVKQSSSFAKSNIISID